MRATIKVAVLVLCVREDGVFGLAGAADGEVGEVSGVEIDYTDCSARVDVLEREVVGRSGGGLV